MWNHNNVIPAKAGIHTKLRNLKSPRYNCSDNWGFTRA